MDVVINRTLSLGKFAWQLLGSATVRATPAATCKADLASFCRPGALVQHEAMWYPATQTRAATTQHGKGLWGQDLVSFLLIRGPYAYFGHGWQGCAQPLADQGGGYPFPSQLNTDFGTPLGLCAETHAGSGVYQREYTKATVKMDCNTGEPSVVLK